METDEILGFRPFSFENEPAERLPYRQRLFNGEQPERPALLLFLHGAGERGDDNQKQVMVHFPEHCVNYLLDRGMKCLVLCPQCPENFQWVNTPWELTEHTMDEVPTEPMKLVIQLLDAKIREFEVDPNRVYVTGISMGGYGTWDLITRHPELFAAAMPICGGGDTAQAEKLKDLPIRIWHGARDVTVPVCRSRNMANALWKVGNAKFDYMELRYAGHDSWTQCYGNPQNFDWLFSWRRH